MVVAITFDTEARSNQWSSVSCSGSGTSAAMPAWLTQRRPSAATTPKRRAGNPPGRDRRGGGREGGLDHGRSSGLALARAMTGRNSNAARLTTPDARKNRSKPL